MKRILAVVMMIVMPGVVSTAAVAQPVVLFDEGHGQQFLARRAGDLDLSELAALFTTAGFEVRSSRERIHATALKGVSALVISGAFAPIAPPELEAIRQFVVDGGRLAVMLHIGQPVQGLLEQLGIQYSRGPAHESEDIISGRSIDFTVTRFEPHALTEGLARLSVFGCWALKPVQNSAGRVIARTGPQAWLDSNRDGARSPDDLAGALGLVVAGEAGSGAYVIFGDDAIFQNRFLKAYNTDIGLRLVRWLAPVRTPEAPSQHPKPGGVTDL